jgi:RHH-type proline utilization regulon transcriptional repressor/proline dehydrogenase/delta 1-pyrroline-5-carboxylate dehydrogenase
MLTGKIVEPDDEAQKDLPAFIKKIAGRLGEPVIRAAVGQAIRIMGEQFVLGRTIEAAIKRAANDGDMCSFDMLGEGARTAADAERYEKSYADAILTVGKLSNAAGPEKPATACRSSCRPCARATRPRTKTACGTSSIRAPCAWP